MTPPRPFREEITTRAEALAAGMTDAQIGVRVRAGAWVRVARGVYATGGPTVDPELRGRGAVAAFPTGLVVASHQTAARLHGLDLGWPGAEREHVTVRAGRHRPSRPEIVVHTARLSAGDVTVIRGVPLTTMRRTLRDLLLGNDRETAIWACEQALSQGAVELDQIADDVRDARRCPRVRRAREWLALVEPRSESALETRIRLCVIDAGLPTPQVQIGVVDGAGWPIARIDLGYPEVKLGIECDGKASHTTPAAVYHDRARANTLQNCGWRILRFTWPDVVRRPSYIAGTIRAALQMLGAAA